jgi:electron transfer flavoprotein alpha subunit
MSNVLVFAEHLHGKFPKTTLVGLTAGKTLAEKSGGKALAIVLGKDVDGLASELASYGVDVVAVDGPQLEHYVADAYTPAIATS